MPEIREKFRDAKVVQYVCNQELQVPSVKRCQPIFDLKSFDSFPLFWLHLEKFPKKKIVKKRDCQNLTITQSSQKFV